MKRPWLPPFQLQPRSYTDNGSCCAEFMWLDSSTTTDQVLDRVANMRRLERTSSYARRDYLYSHDSPYYYHHHTTSNKSNSSSDYYNDSTRLMDALYVLGPLPSAQSPALTPTGSKKRSLSSSSSSWHQHHHQRHSTTSIYHPYINEKTRQYTVDLLYDIADYCHFRRETVGFAIWNLLDRYLSCAHAKPLETYADLQKLALACLLVAVKCLEPVSIDVVSLAALSRGNFSAHDVLEMEQTILVQLQWKVAHGPTPIVFCQHYLTLLHLDGVLQTMSSDTTTTTNNNNSNMDGASDDDDDDDTHWELLDSLLEQAQYQVELAASQYHLVTQRHPSEIALAAVWNALEAQLLDTCTATAQSLEAHLARRLALAGFDLLSDADSTTMIAKIQLTLCKLQYKAQTTVVPIVPVPITQHQQPQQPQLPPIPQVQSMEEQSDSLTTSTTTATSSVDSTTLCNTSCCSHPGNDDDDEQQQQQQEATERDDNDSFQQHFSLLYPSPISVMTTNPVLSANTNTNTTAQTNKSHNNSNTNKETNTESTVTSAYDTYYDFSFLKRLFFA